MSVETSLAPKTARKCLIPLTWEKMAERVGFAPPPVPAGQSVPSPSDRPPAACSARIAMIGCTVETRRAEGTPASNATRNATVAATV